MGKGTLFVPAAHGSDIQNEIDPEGVACRRAQRLRVHQNLRPVRPHVRPFQGRRMKGERTVGGGHKKRALAHGY